LRSCCVWCCVGVWFVISRPVNTRCIAFLHYFCTCGFTSFRECGIPASGCVQLVCTLLPRHYAFCATGCSVSFFPNPSVCFLLTKHVSKQFVILGLWALSQLYPSLYVCNSKRPIVTFNYAVVFSCHFHGSLQEENYFRAVFRVLWVLSVRAILILSEI
jgi:hypothetical protein